MNYLVTTLLSITITLSCIYLHEFWLENGFEITILMNLLKFFLCVIVSLVIYFYNYFCAMNNKEKKTLPIDEMIHKAIENARISNNVEQILLKKNDSARSKIDNALDDKLFKQPLPKKGLMILEDSSSNKIKSNAYGTPSRSVLSKQIPQTI